MATDALTVAEQPAALLDDEPVDVLRRHVAPEVLAVLQEEASRSAEAADVVRYLAAAARSAEYAAARRFPSPRQDAERRSFVVGVLQLEWLALASPDLRRLLHLRYGLGGEPHRRSTRQIAAELGERCEVVRDQIRAMDGLVHPLRGVPVVLGRVRRVPPQCRPRPVLRRARPRARASRTRSPRGSPDPSDDGPSSDLALLHTRPAVSR